MKIHSSEPLKLFSAEADSGCWGNSNDFTPHVNVFEVFVLMNLTPFLQIVETTGIN